MNEFYNISFSRNSCFEKSFFASQSQSVFLVSARRHLGNWNGIPDHSALYRDASKAQSEHNQLFSPGQIFSVSYFSLRDPRVTGLSLSLCHFHSLPVKWSASLSSLYLILICGSWCLQWRVNDHTGLYPWYSNCTAATCK